MRIWQKEGDSLSSNVFPRKTFRQLTGLVRQTRRVSVEWRLVRYVRSIRLQPSRPVGMGKVCRGDVEDAAGEDRATAGRWGLRRCSLLR